MSVCVFARSQRSISPEAMRRKQNQRKSKRRTANKQSPTHVAFCLPISMTVINKLPYQILVSIHGGLHSRTPPLLISLAALAAGPTHDHTGMKCEHQATARCSSITYIHSYARSTTCYKAILLSEASASIHAAPAVRAFLVTGCVVVWIRVAIIPIIIRIRLTIFRHKIGRLVIVRI